MSLRIAPAALAAVSFAGTMAWAGHELPIYPSYYPHEIDIQTVAPERALDLIARGQIQAYAGAAPPPAALPNAVGAVESLARTSSSRLTPARRAIRARSRRRQSMS